MRQGYSNGKQGEPREEPDPPDVETEPPEDSDNDRQVPDHDQDLHALPANRQGGQGRLEPVPHWRDRTAAPVPSTALRAVPARQERETAARWIPRSGPCCFSTSLPGSQQPAPTKSRSRTPQCSPDACSGTSGNRRAPTRPAPGVASGPARRGCPGWGAR